MGREEPRLASSSKKNGLQFSPFKPAWEISQCPRSADSGKLQLAGMPHWRGVRALVALLAALAAGWSLLFLGWLRLKIGK